MVEVFGKLYTLELNYFLREVVMIKMNLAQNSISTEMLEHIYSGLPESADEIEKAGCSRGCSCGCSCSDGDDDEANIGGAVGRLIDAGQRAYTVINAAISTYNIISDYVHNQHDPSPGQPVYDGMGNFTGYYESLPSNPVND
jgi:hypothetical protein